MAKNAAGTEFLGEEIGKTIDYVSLLYELRCSKPENPIAIIDKVLKDFSEYIEYKLEKPAALFPVNLLSSVIKGNHPKALEYLIEKKVNIKLGVYMAAIYGRPECLEIIIKHGGKVDFVPIAMLFSPLFHAINNDNLQCAEILLQNGAEPNYEVLGRSPMNCAIKNHNANAVKLLAYYGAKYYGDNPAIKTLIESFLNYVQQQKSGVVDHPQQSEVDITGKVEKEVVTEDV